MTQTHRSTRVRSLDTASGITIWHVEDYTVPVFSLEFAFIGGAAHDPTDQPGLGNLMASLLDEGAGPYDSEAFQEALEECAIELSFDAGRDRIEGSLRSLSEHADEAFRLLRLAVQEPRFDDASIDRVRGQVIASLKQSESDPQQRARDALNQTAFAGHAYGQPVDGTITSLGAFKRAHLAAQHQKLLARSKLLIVCVGAIGADALIAGVEAVFGALPATTSHGVVSAIELKGRGSRQIVDLDIPQSTLYLAMPGLRRKDPDFMAASVVNHIFGGGSFTSRLWTEIREKRGLAYSVWSTLAPFRHAALFMAGTATSNERVAESLSVIDAELRRMAEGGPTQDELDKAKNYLIGSYALRFDTSRKIAHVLLDIRTEDLGIDYIDRRNQEIAGVSLESARAAAQRLFVDTSALVVVAGRPVGL